MKQLAVESNAAARADECATLLMEVAPQVMRRIRQEMRSRTMAGLSLPQFRTLVYLRRHAGATLSEVAEFVGLTLPSTSKLVEKLVAQKAVARRFSTLDRRCVQLSLTEHGRAALEAAREGTQRQLAEALATIPPCDLDRIEDALRVLGRTFSPSPAAGRRTNAHSP